MPVNLLDYDAPRLAAYCEEIGERPFRAKQLLHWMHQSGESDFSHMTDLAKSLRDKLGALAVVAAPQVISDTTAADGTRKWLLSVGAANGIETVFIPETNRGTLCISSQVGCALECTFCSTGRQGFNRNLTVAEIIGQLWWANKSLGNRDVSLNRGSELGLTSPSPLGGEGRGQVVTSGGSLPLSQYLEGTSEGGSDQVLPVANHVKLKRNEKGERKITNVVMMGMGEPLANFENVVSALDLMLDDHAYGLSRRRVTVSTSGIVPAMDRLRERCPVALAVSLHAPDDALRDVLVPINKKYPLAQLMAACRRYLENAPRDFVTFEYVMLAGINDSVAQARELVKLVKDTPCKFNLIPFNPFPNSGYQRSGFDAIGRFRDVLMQADLVVTVRKTRGDDIDAACGQLAGEVQDKTGRQVRYMTEVRA